MTPVYRPSVRPSRNPRRARSSPGQLARYGTARGGAGGILAVRDEGRRPLAPAELARHRPGELERGGSDRAWEYEVTEVTLKLQRNDVAANGLVHPEKLERHNERRRFSAPRCREAFSRCEKIQPLPSDRDLPEADRGRVVDTAGSFLRHV